MLMTLSILIPVCSAPSVRKCCQHENDAVRLVLQNNKTSGSARTCQVAKLFSVLAPECKKQTRTGNIESSNQPKKRTKPMTSAHRPPS